MAALRTVFCKNLFTGKVAIVTGGGTGIGKAISSELARLGCKVVIASRKMDTLQVAATQINHEVAEMEKGGAARVTTTSLPERVYPYQCNIRKEEQVISVLVKNGFLHRHWYVIRSPQQNWLAQIWSAFASQMTQ